VTDERADAEQFAELFRAVYLTFHRRDGPRSQLAGASRALRRDREVLGVDLVARALARLPPGQADDLIAALRALVEAAAPAAEAVVSPD
jgi:hypothetical protein